MESLGLCDREEPSVSMYVYEGISSVIGTRASILSRLSAMACQSISDAVGVG